MFVQGETIAAIATAVVPQQGSVGIVRMSGIDAIAIARTLFHAPGRQAWESHQILYGYVRHPQTKQLVDEALLLLMQAPRSYTREDVVEFHCHGGIMPVQQVLQLCIEQGAKLAQPGEFTLRAFLNGRLDLTQAESIADLVGSRSPQAAQAALAGLQGKLAVPIRQLRATCLDILAEIEARIDFEEDLPPLDEAAIIAQIEQAIGRSNEYPGNRRSGGTAPHWLKSCYCRASECREIEFVEYLESERSRNCYRLTWYYPRCRSSLSWWLGGYLCKCWIRQGFERQLTK
jgi:tRNA modification GTPase